MAVNEAPPHDPFDDVAAHVLAKIGLGFADDGGGSAVVFDPDPILVDGAGHVGFGALGILFDLASSTALDREAFRPFVHADITVHRLRPAAGQLVASARMARQGRRTGIAMIDLRDQHGTIVAASTQEIVFTATPAEATPRMEKMRDSFRSMFDGTCRLARPLEDELGITQASPGEWSMALRADRTNGFGGLHGGVATTLVDAAAAGTMSARWDAPARTVSAAVRYLAPALTGPFLAQPAVLVDSGSFAVLRVPIVDTGDDDRLVILAEAHVAP